MNEAMAAGTEFAPLGVAIFSLLDRHVRRVAARPRVVSGLRRWHRRRSLARRPSRTTPRGVRLDPEVSEERNELRRVMEDQDFVFSSESSKSRRKIDCSF